MIERTKNIANVVFKGLDHGISREFITYTCTNHPEIILNEPGNCPECGKALVKKY